jgi:valyl-tRNA synthetase
LPPAAQAKEIDMELATRYEPQATEEAIYRRWLEANCFRATPDGNPKRYCVTIPPPNVTGALHLGHALNHTLMDALGRRKRMLGFNTLILPGTDHAGIATQSVVEREIAKQKLTRHDLGREKFVERVWEWKEEYGGRIVGQLQRLGCAYDWDRLRFTMDEGYVDAIMTVFARLYEQGYIYLGNRIVNWCPFHRTAISDIEVEHVEEKGSLYHIRYDFTDGSGSVTVATTRPETMLGDVAVAVNPSDPRYQGQIGKTLTLPLVGREIPLIGDDFAQVEFGTGAVKVTPAHDPNDFEAGQRHHLPQIIVIGPDGKMNENAGATYAGLDRFEARKRVVADLEERGYLVKIEDHVKSVGRCDRCKTVIEPLLSKQWFCKMGGTPMVDKAIADAAEDRVTFVPARYKDTYLRWMENIRDWPISRQLWWGHRMPLWRREDSDPDDQTSYVVARTEAEARAKLGGGDLYQVEDVLDTWFSSALWPFATLGWPQDNESLRYYYPTDALFTAQEILYLWVARMIMTGEEFMGEKPFADVYIHATILDEHGGRMSKSKGNGVDPVDLIELYGADALRFTLAREAGMRQDIRFKPIKNGKQEQVEQARNFANKIWNASRFALLNLEGYTPPADAPQPTALVDRWILSRLDATAEAVNAGFETYNVDDAARALFEFFWDDFCDWYIEAAKFYLTSDAADQTKHVLWYTLEQSLRLLHPIMPYLTEAIWQSLPGAKENAGKDYLMFAAFPEAGRFDSIEPHLVTQNGFTMRWDDEQSISWDVVQTIVRSIRALQAENNLKKGGEAYFEPSDALAQHVAELHKDLIKSLTRTTLLIEKGPANALLSATTHGTVRIARPEASPEEIAAEKARIERDLAKIDKDLAGLNARLSDEKFTGSAPEAVVAKARQQQAELNERREKLSERLAQLGA